MAVVLAGALGLAGVVIVLLGAAGPTRATNSLSPYALGLENPPYFVATSPAGIHTTLQLRSAATGQVLETIKTFGQSFTNNGLALSPNGRDVYFTLIPNTKSRSFNLLLERISVTTKKQTLIAHGELPAVSPDDRMLAYVTGPRSSSIAVRDVASGVTRSIDLTDLLGTHADVFNGVLTWLANGSELALVTSTTSPTLVGRHRTVSSHAKPTLGHCRGQRTAVCLIVVNLPTAGGPLTARPYPLPKASGLVTAIAPDATAPGSFLIGRASGGDNAVIEAITPNHTTVSVHRLASIPSGLAMTFDATGSRLLYLLGHSPPALWLADITQAGLTNPLLLIRNSQIGAAW